MKTRHLILLAGILLVGAKQAGAADVVRSTAAGTATWGHAGNLGSPLGFYIGEVSLDRGAATHGDGYDSAMRVDVTGDPVDTEILIHYSTTYAMAIQLVKISNTNFTAQTYTIRAHGNLGSDSNTRWHYAGTNGPYYTISSDKASAATDGSDPVVSFLYGDGSVNNYGTSHSMPYTNGIDNANFQVNNVTLPAGATHGYLFLTGVGDIDDPDHNRPDMALTAVTALASPVNWPAEFCSFLSETERSQIVNWSGVPASSIDEHIFIHKDAASYTAFPELFTLPDGRLSIRVTARENVSHTDPTGAVITKVSNDEGQTWTDFSGVFASQDWVKDDGRFITASAGGWVQAPASERAALEAEHRYVIDADDPAYVLYLGDPSYWVSEDDGATWTNTAIAVPTDVKGTMSYLKGACEIVTSDGVHLVAVYGNRYLAGKSYAENYGIFEVFFLRSDDDGNSWNLVFLTPDGIDQYHPTGGMNESALVENERGEIICMSRTYAGDEHTLYQSISKDGGLTWSDPVDSGMRGSPAQMIRLRDGRILCTYGYRLDPGAILARISNDGGRTWPGIDQELLIREGFYTSFWNWGYPLSVQVSDGSLVSAYYATGMDGTTYSAVTRWRTAVYTDPYVEPFEIYAPGFQMAGADDWSADEPYAAGISTNEAMIAALTGSYSGGFPIATNHTKVLQVNGNVTNAIYSGAAQRVKVDCIVSMPSNPIVPDLPIEEQTAFYVDASSGHVNLMHARTADGASFTNEWLAPAGGPVLGSNDWVRLTVLLDYTNKMFQIQLNDGAAISSAVGWTGPGGTQPGSWFYMVNRSGTSLEKIKVSGMDFWMDDLLVEPQGFYRLTVSSGFGGDAAPGAGWYGTGAEVGITASPDSWYSFDTWMGSIGAITTGTATDPAITVTMNNPVTLNAGFEADATSGGTPHWWLAQENPVWTNDFEAAAANDFDNDGALTSNEYIAGTGSTDSNSVFVLNVDGTSVDFQTVETTPQHGGLNRWYSLQSSSNLPSGLWEGVPGYTNILGAGQSVVYSNSAPIDAEFFSGSVWLEE
ncbi:MAG: exo-alpha-sialidase [Verrucomicrobiota bacterium]